MCCRMLPWGGTWAVGMVEGYTPFGVGEGLWFRVWQLRGSGVCEKFGLRGGESGLEVRRLLRDVLPQSVGR